jgi:hypothetical protein
VQQLLWIETLVKFAGGMVLVIAPLTAIRALGLPGTDSGFWPRILGAVLIGLAAATYLEGRSGGAAGGVGLAGCFLINIAAVAVLTALQVLGRGAQTRRGEAALWLLVVLLLLLVVFEIAHI